MTFEKGDRVQMKKMQGREGVVIGFMEHPDGRILTVERWGGAIEFWRESECMPYHDIENRGGE